MTAPSAERGRYAHVRFISAGAGSGKTYRLTAELEHALVDEGVDPGRVIGTTFTVKAAAELRERVRERLIRGGRTNLAEQTAEALIGTVHSVCERLLKRFAFELGLSPALAVASIEDGVGFFDQALDEALTAADVREMNALSARLDIDDWRRDVKSIADRARDNDVAPDALTEMGRRSADDLLALFPAPEAGDLDGRLLERVRAALAALDAGSDATVGTAKYQAALKRAIYQLRRPPVPWPLWMSLATGKGTKASEPVAAPVREAAAAFAAHPRFHADIRRYVERVYAIAAAALARFRAIKRQRGLIDFTDMEQQLLHALDTPAIRARIAAELDLLLVDEFQDTNPMQLAIFMKLAELADHVVFVGDVKQAIYAFRGCDPDLVFELLAELAAQGGDADVLEHSWRSRPALVDYVNAVFGEAFAGTLDPAEVALEAKRGERTGEPAVLRWTLPGRSGRAQAQGLAHAARELVESGYEVVDRETDAARPVRWGDIAVLAASNDHVEEIAKALRAAQVPMKMTLTGLLTVPEICLARACLRRLSDSGDTLATAEIVALSDCGEPEAWLADRLRWLAEGGESYAWGAASHPIAAKLEALRGGIGTQSPVEIVARVLNTIGIREVVTAWGPDAIRAAQRQRNLDALLNLAVEYERHCEAQHFAATLTGLLFWLEHPHSPELDLQPVVTTGDAVHVLTYHRAKGLEWPVVIAADLHYRWRPRLWDVRAENDGAAFDLRRPLANRVIRFWPPLFGRRKDLPVLDAIVASDEGRLCIAKGLDESRRLAYVGLTRARDALVLAVPSAQPKEDVWLHALGTDKVLPEGDRLDLPGGRSIATRAVALDGGGGTGAAAPFEPRRLPERAPAPAPARARIHPSEAPPLLAAAVAETVDLGARIAVGGEDMTAIGAALHAAIAAELVNPDRDDALERTRALLEGHGVEGCIAAADALAAARRLRAWVEQRFAPRRILAEYPIVHARADGHAVHGWIDVLAETESDCVVIDHKSSPRPRSEWAGEACEYSGQLELYRAALEAAGQPVQSCWIHFPVGGGLVRVDLG
jgi:ATP-dependent exoDNAse (exonuclease V) beta subunit